MIVRVSISPVAEPFMKEAWNAALRDSTLPASSVHLLLVPGSAVQDHNKAACYPPGKN